MNNNKKKYAYYITKLKCTKSEKIIKEIIVRNIKCTKENHHKKYHHLQQN